jgi:hypothetical protein
MHFEGGQKFTIGHWSALRRVAICRIENIVSKRLLTEEDAANAKLIAASPNMYEAILRIYTGLHPNVGGATISRQEILDICEEAISKAATPIQIEEKVSNSIPLDMGDDPDGDGYCD